MDKQNLMYAYDGISFNLKEGMKFYTFCHIDEKFEGMILRERSQTQKEKYDSTSMRSLEWSNS